MNLKLIVAILAMAVVPAGAQAQKPGGAKPTVADAQKVVKLISADKAKTQFYCDIAKLSDQIGEADQKKDNKMVEELAQKLDALVEKLGPEYTALMEGLQDIDPDSKISEEIGAALEALDKLCAK
jgi:ABC-type Zn uptake system ZnuABC Zn-binding protein ZnuA